MYWARLNWGSRINFYAVAVVVANTRGWHGGGVELKSADLILGGNSVCLLVVSINNRESVKF